MHSPTPTPVMKRKKTPATVDASAIPPWLEHQQLDEGEMARRMAAFERTMAAATATSIRLQSPLVDPGRRLPGAAPLSSSEAREILIKAGILTATGKVARKHR